MTDDQANQLANTIERLNKHHGLWPSFLRGMMGGLGATIGAGLVLGILGYILQQLSVFPALKDEIQSLLPKIEERAFTLPHETDVTIPIQEERIETVSEPESTQNQQNTPR